LVAEYIRVVFYLLATNLITLHMTISTGVTPPTVSVPRFVSHFAFPRFDCAQALPLHSFSFVRMYIAILQAFSDFCFVRELSCLSLLLNHFHARSAFAAENTVPTKNYQTSSLTLSA
jgi:hypothetical protein